MNVDRRWLGASALRVRLLAAGLTLLGAACMILALASRLPQSAAKDGPPSRYPALALANPLTTFEPTPDAPSPPSRARAIFAGLPLIFEPNQGQANLDPADPRARFVARGSGYTLFLGSDSATLSLRSRILSKHGVSPVAAPPVRMKLAGANPNAVLTGADILPGKSNYILGNDPAKWRRGIPQFARVRYAQVYPGIDLVFYGNQGRLEYDFQVAPGSDPAQAELEFDGAQRLALQDGALIIHGQNRQGKAQRDGDSVRLEAPRVYQLIAGRQQPVEGRFVLRGSNRAGFVIGAYDHSRQLVIDPVLTFSTYFGGTLDEKNSSVAVDGAGNIYLAGSTTSDDLLTFYPVTGVFQTKLGGAGATNVYIAKITPPLGSNPAFVDYLTYLGGSGIDYPVGISADGAGNAYVAGTTTSGDFPTTGTAYQNLPESGSAGPHHVFVTELNGGPTPPPASELLYSSYLSGNGDDIASGMTIDASGDIYVTGTTTSVEALLTTNDQFPATQYPQPPPFQNASRAPGKAQFFVTKVYTNAPKNSSIAYSTYFGGGNFTLPPPPAPQTPAIGGGIAVDTSAPPNIYFTGTTDFTYTGCAGCSTTDFPILNAYQPCLDQPSTTAPCSNTSSTSNFDAFVAKLNPGAPQGSQLLWSTYLGGSENDSGTGIALDSGAANVYVTGTTNSQDFVSASSLTTFAPYQKCLNNLPPTTSSTVTCTTQTNPAPNDAFVARLSNPTNTTGTPTNVSLTYFSYLGGSTAGGTSGNDEGLAIAVDSASGALVTGWTESQDFPVSSCGDIQCTIGTTPGTRDAFVARINTVTVTGQTTTGSWASYFGGTTSGEGASIGEGTSITLDVNQNTYFAGDTNATDLESSGRLVKPLQSQNNGGYDATVAQVGPKSTLSISGILSGTQAYVAAGNQATFVYTLTNSGPDLATNITVTDNLSSTGIPVTLNSASVPSPGSCNSSSGSAVVSCSIPSLQSGSTATITIVLTPAATGGSAQFNGGTVIASAANGITPAQTVVPAQVSDFSMAVSPSNVTLQAAGDTAIYQVQLTPHPVYPASISLSASGQPTGATPSFSSSSVLLQGASPGTSTLSITTTPRPTTTAGIGPRHFYAIWLTLPGLAVLGIGVGGNQRRRRWAAVLLASAVLVLLLLQPACSHTITQPPVSGTPAGTYTLTVTATSGTDTKSTSIILTVP